MDCGDCPGFRAAAPPPSPAAAAATPPLAPSRPATAGPRAAGTVRHAPRPAAAAVTGPGTVLVVDGPSLAHRAYHAYEPQATRSSSGAPIWAVAGFVALFAGILDKVRPAAVVVGWDGDAEGSIRRIQWAGYKAGRPPKPADLTAQLEAIPRLVADAGFTSMCPHGWEADDVLASVSAAAEAAGGYCVVATSDRDAFSLISDRTRVLRLVSGLNNAIMMGPQELEDRHGLRAVPNQYLDFAALRGDASDNLPGVSGIGEKTAVKLLTALGSVPAALADEPATVAAIGRAYAAKLFAGVDAWRVNRQVMALRGDLPVDLAGAGRLPHPQQVMRACGRFEVSGSRLVAVLDRARGGALQGATT